ncbi:MAG: LysR family transcriptional regulator [Gammaproteobacteria bacterium]|nr:LysR family transcriptional regulator [Gammaproteobacteria bacterium]
MSSISPLELRVLLKLLDSGSFTAAAVALDLDKSQVSRVVARVERRLGVRLFERSTRALRATALGAEVCARARQVLAGLEGIETLAAEHGKAPAGTLRLACGVEFGSLAVSGWIATCLARQPAMAVDADFSNRVVDIIEEGFDIAIRLGDALPSDLPVVRLGALGYGLFASPVTLAGAPLPDHPSLLSARAVLRYAVGSHGGAWRMTRDGETLTMRAHGRVTVNNVFALADAARAGLGIARLPRLLARDYLARGELMEVFADWTLATVAVHAVLPGNRHVPPKTHAFLDVARAAMGGSADLGCAERFRANC